MAFLLSLFFLLISLLFFLFFPAFISYSPPTFLLLLISFPSSSFFFFLLFLLYPPSHFSFALCVFILLSRAKNFVALSRRCCLSSSASTSSSRKWNKLESWREKEKEREQCAPRNSCLIPSDRTIPSEEGREGSQENRTQQNYWNSNIARNETKIASMLREAQERVRERCKSAERVSIKQKEQCLRAISQQSRGRCLDQ